MLEYDVFVSYAHIDNRPLASDQGGWITSFTEALDAALSQELGRPARIWRDPKVNGNDEFAAKLAEKISRAVLLVPVLSRSYLNSEWCLDELRLFLEGAEATGGVRLGYKNRTFKVVKGPIGRDEHPASLQGQTGYEFYDEGSEAGVEYFDLLSGPKSERRFFARVLEMARAMGELLRQIDEQAPSVVRAAPPAAGAPVFLAQTTPDLRSERQKIEEELRQRGHRILPEETLPQSVAELTGVLSRALAEAELSIHQIGSSYDFTVELQNQLAAERAAAGDFQRLFWIRPAIETDDQRQRNLIHQLRTGEAAQLGVDLLEGPIEELKDEILKKLAPEPEPQGGNGRGGDDSLKSVYLICEPPDMDCVAPLRSALKERGYPVMLPDFEGDAAEVRQEHQEKLKICAAALLYYGAARESWLFKKLGDLKKIYGLGRSLDEPLLATAIYLAEPARAAKKEVPVTDVDTKILDGLGGFDPGILKPFLNQLAS